MKSDKIRNLTDEELLHQERDLNDQLFKLKFQLNMGQTGEPEEDSPLRHAPGYRARKDHQPGARTRRQRQNGA